jgi:DNA-binding MarR family transcriptional regulator
VPVLTSASETGTQFFELFHRIRKVAEERMGAQGLSLARAKTLEVIDTDGPIRLRALADRFDCSAATITDMMDGLERDGLATRTPDPTDRRAYLVTITPAGRKAAAKARATRTALLDGVFGALSEAERKQFTTIVERLASNPILNGESS